MSSGVSYKEEAYQLMHYGKRNGFTLEVLLAAVLKPGIVAIIKEKYGSYEPRLSANERYKLGHRWDGLTRRWVRPEDAVNLRRTGRG